MVMPRGSMVVCVYAWRTVSTTRSTAAGGTSPNPGGGVREACERSWPGAETGSLSGRPARSGPRPIASSLLTRSIHREYGTGPSSPARARATLFDRRYSSNATGRTHSGQPRSPTRAQGRTTRQHRSWPGGQSAGRAGGKIGSGLLTPDTLRTACPNVAPGKIGRGVTRAPSRTGPRGRQATGGRRTMPARHAGPPPPFTPPATHGSCSQPPTSNTTCPRN